MSIRITPIIAIINPGFILYIVAESLLKVK